MTFFLQDHVVGVLKCLYRHTDASEAQSNWSDYPYDKRIREEQMKTGGELGSFVPRELIVSSGFGGLSTSTTIDSIESKLSNEHDTLGLGVLDYSPFLSLDQVFQRLRCVSICFIEIHYDSLRYVMILNTHTCTSFML